MLKWLQRLTPILAVFLTGFAQPTCDQPSNFSLGLTSYGQQQNYWCWAASGAMLMNFIHPASNVTQCNEAQHLVQNSSLNCCANPAKCNKPGYPDFAHYNFSAQQSSKTSHFLSAGDVKTQLACQNSPFAFIWKYATGGSHMLAAIGYAYNSTGQFSLLVNDPLPVNQGNVYFVAYQDYSPTSPYSAYTLSDNYYSVTYTGP